EIKVLIENSVSRIDTGSTQVREAGETMKEIVNAVTRVTDIMGGIVIGLCFGIPVDRIMMLYVLPIMGGGNGAGAVPLSEIYHSV
ncbi:2-hydroxycarboxylate transporter family protein, partial [Salmonella enterica subsp. enterica serovar Virginia]|nr:2-hydroxycarboxylate transporter family protein [Salmonella enterica subsp. enterica serovar Virginia]